MGRYLAGIGLFTVVAAAAASVTTTRAQAPGPGRAAYDQIKDFKLGGDNAPVSGFTLKRDRVEMSFTGTFFFGPKIDGRVTGAVFVGDGTLRAEPPPTSFERDNVKRILGADVVESDFKSAVLRFADDTADAIAAARTGERGGPPPADAQKLADEADARVLQEIGANLSARLAASFLNGDSHGIFSAQFDGGRRGHFGYIFDPESRLQVSAFGLSAGERGVIYQYQSALSYTEVWMAFYGLDNYAANSVVYSDANDVVDVTAYHLNLDVRQIPRMTMNAAIEMKVVKDGVRAVPFNVGENLSASQNMRLDNQLRVQKASLGGQSLDVVQEDWEGGFTVFLPKPAQAGETIRIDLDLAGAFLQILGAFPECYYPYSNDTWLPRHGYLDRATFEMTFRHRKREKVAATGQRLSEEPDPDDAQGMITKFKLDHSVPLATFALGPFERKTKTVTFEGGGAPIPLEFNSVPARVLSKTTMTAVNHELILDELDNAIRYFAATFGRYPYETFSSAFHPFGFGQGFPTLLMIPPATRTGGGRDTDVFTFFAHETAHQWWGGIVAWRSYRDQWLSEGFAEYSGMLYAAKRDKDATKAMAQMVRSARDSLRQPPAMANGSGKGRLDDVGPIVAGRRLVSLKAVNAYSTLVYNKGALVLRMLHFLMSNPSNGNDAAFTAMMQDFVGKYRNGAARTEDFWQVASQHFARTPIAQKFGIANLDWFFRQWVYQTGLPAYTLEYELKPQPDGSVMLSGVVKQEGVPEDWVMVLPLVMSFEGNQEARTTVRAAGASAPFELKLPAAPKKVELDPFSWVLSEKTTTRAK